LKCDRLLSGDTAGRIKCWDITKADFRRRDHDHMQDVRISWYVQAHKKVGGSVNSLGIVQKFKSDRFVISASADNNILLHRISNGVKVGQFSQDKQWRIDDMSRHNGKANIVREWIRERLSRWIKFLEERIKIGIEKEILEEEVTTKNYK